MGIIEKENENQPKFIKLCPDGEFCGNFKGTKI
jgi:hypothetical protein